MYRFLRLTFFAVLLAPLFYGDGMATVSSPADSTGESGDKMNNIPQAVELLKKADEVRSPWPGFTMRADLSYEKFGELKEESFRVFTRDYVKTLVSYIDPIKQRGNMLLMIDENLWYYVHKTQRPMRITPIQKLSGGASYGDITRLSWSRDYDPVMMGEGVITVGETSHDAWLLRLTAHSKSATYHTIDLYVEKNTFYPRKAVVYLQSGKKMKTMFFAGYRETAGKMMNTTIEFVDHLSSDRLTTLVFSDVVAMESPARFFLKSSLPSLYSEIVY